MLIVIGRDDRNVQLQEEEEGSGSNTGSGSSGEESDGEDELPFSMSRAGLAVVRTYITSQLHEPTVFYNI